MYRRYTNYSRELICHRIKEWSLLCLKDSYVVHPEDLNTTGFNLLTSQKQDTESQLLVSIWYTKWKPEATKGMILPHLSQSPSITTHLLYIHGLLLFYILFRTSTQSQRFP